MSVTEPKFHCRKEKELICSESELQIENTVKAAVRYSR